MISTNFNEGDIITIFNDSQHPENGVAKYYHYNLYYTSNYFTPIPSLETYIPSYEAFNTFALTV